MTIKDSILNPYFIDFDGVQYTLKEICKTEKGDNIGNEYEQVHGYFTDLTYAIKKICQLEISKKDSLTLKEFLEEWKKLMNKFKPLFYDN